MKRIPWAQLCLVGAKILFIEEKMSRVEALCHGTKAKITWIEKKKSPLGFILTPKSRGGRGRKEQTFFIQLFNYFAHILYGFSFSL